MSNKLKYTKPTFDDSRDFSIPLSDCIRDLVVVERP